MPAHLKSPEIAIIKANNATAWLLLIAAQANRDIAQFGEWRTDYIAMAQELQEDYEVALMEI
jgi:hypothetical protein